MCLVRSFRLFKNLRNWTTLQGIGVVSVEHAFE